MVNASVIESKTLKIEFTTVFKPIYANITIYKTKSTIFSTYTSYITIRFTLLQTTNTSFFSKINKSM